MQLHDLLADLAGFDGAGVLEMRAGSAGTPAEVKSVVHDSRDAGPGALFCCIRGATTDGHAYAPEAVRTGASALMVEEWVPVDVPQARVGSVRAVLGPLAARFHGEPSFAMRVLGVTGTNGKTTVTYLLESIAIAAGESAGVIGTVAARVGEEVLSTAHTTPEATELQSLLARMRDSNVDTVAMEVSSHSLEQHRVDSTNFAATCFTNLSHDHLDYHGSVDAYFEAKARLFTPVFTQRAAVNVSDPYGEKLARRAAGSGLVVTRFAGSESALGDPTADVRARRVELTPTGTTFELATCSGKPVRVRTHLVGSFNVANALAAATTALLAGFELDTIVAGLERPIVVPGRMERVDAGQEFAVIVDYAHSPDALQSVLGAARELVRPGARLIVVFGCGGDRDREKRPLMGEIAARVADRVYVTTDNPRTEDPAAIIDDIISGVPSGSAVETILDRRAAIREAVRAAQPGDVVVVAGKGHEPGQIIGDRTEPFDDRVVTRAELEAAGMMTTTAAEIARRTRGVVISGTADAIVTSWAFDSRALEPGACFVALQGDRDGHDFVAGALSAGATVALVSRPVPGAKAPDAAAIVQVEDVLASLQGIAMASRAGRPELSVVAVAGSTGKTSTKDLLAAVLEPLGCYASPESYNNEFGLPITLLNTSTDARVVVAEMGERFPGDVAALCAVARPDIGVVTNVGLAHAEHLGGKPGAAKAMGEMLTSLPAGGLAVLNADDEWTRTLEVPDGVEIATVGMAAAADYRIEDVSLDEHLHPTFTLNGERVTVPLHGHHHALNAGLALAVAHRGFDIDLSSSAAGLAGVRPARWRLEMHVNADGVTVLNDAYNANPASMNAALRVLAHTATAGRRIAVLGDMRELGVHSDEAHAAVGRQASESRVDVLIGVGDGGRVIADAARVNISEVLTAGDAQEALRITRTLASPGDTVLVKASRAVGLEVIAEQLLEVAS